MRRRLALAAAVLLGVATIATPAAAERLVTSISRHQVLVNSNFTGTSIVLFGTVEPDSAAARRRTAYDLVVTVTGPKQTMVTRRKERVLGIWTNLGSRTFLNAPSYLAVLSNQPLEQITSPETVRQQKLGIADKVFPQQLGIDVGDVVRDDPFRANFIRLDHINRNEKLHVALLRQMQKLSRETDLVRFNAARADWNSLRF